IDRLEGGSRQYNMPAALRLRGALDVPALQFALDALLARHEILRTLYADVDGEPVQIVRPAQALALAVSDLRACDASVRDRELAAVAHDEAALAFDLAADLPLRCRLVLLDRDDHALVFTLHHIASDGWSTGVLVREFVALYASRAQGRDAGLPALPIQYADYAAWQRQRLQGEALQNQVRYWRDHLADLPVVHQLPLDRPRPAQQRFAGAAVERVAPPSLLPALKALALQHDASLFMLLHAAFATLLGRWSGAADIVVGTPIAGRVHPDLEPLIGFFVNTLVLRTDLSGDPRLVDVLDQVRTRALAAYAHQDVPFEMLVDELKPVRSLSHAPLFQILLTLKTTGSAELSLPGLQLSALADGDELAKFDLQLTAEETADGLRLSWLYAQDLFEADSIARLAAAYEDLLQAFVATPQQTLGDLVPAATRDMATIDAWNRSQAPFDERCFHHLFETQVARSPGAVAVSDAQSALSYAELDRRANRVAHVLRARGAGPETLVGLCLPRTVDLAVALLGILKAGAAYLPLDPGSPDAHLHYIVRDSGAALALADAEACQRLAGTGVALLDIADPAVAAASEVTPAVDVRSDNAAYCIYTSGSSGRPKGVLIEHRSLANLAANLGPAGIAGGVIRGCWALAASSAFDGSIKALVQWAHGGEVLIVPEATKLDAVALRALLARRHVDVMDCTPSLLAAWFAAGLDDCLPNLVIGGEPIDRALWQRLVDWQAAQGRYAINVYGPTECCVDTTAMRIEGTEPVIGRPLANVQCHVLDAQGRALPPGVAGELYIGGVGVGRGYVNQPELTAQKFVASPFDPAQRLYRSGDRVRWRNDGTIDYLGRLDDQVKLRGFRIEPGEIESRLRLLGAREAAVVVCGDGLHARLVAYVAGSGADLVDRLKACLAAELPAYLQPAAYVVLDRLPLTANGKVDRRALPEPELPAQAFIAPEGDTELRLAAIWSRILRQDSIGADANFFALGGHSLLATRVASEIAKTFGKPLPVRAIFEHGSVRALAAYLDAQAVSGYASIPRVPREDVLPLSFAQQRLWFIDRLEGGSRQYHMPAALKLVGRLDRIALQRALDALVARHEVLRTRFAEVDDMPVQVIGAAEGVVIAVSDLRTLDTAARDAELARLAHGEAGVPFDLSRDLLLRCRLVLLGDDVHALLLTVHHIASDGWSTAVMVREFAAHYGACVSGGAAALPDLPIQYADYAAWQRDRLSGDALQAQLEYWRDQLAGLPTLHELPLDKPRPAQQRFAGARLESRTSATLQDALKTLALTEGASLFMLLQAAFAVLIGRWSGAHDIVVGTPIAGRVHPELDHLIGCFVNTLVLRTDLRGEPTFLDVLAQARTRALAAYAHQEVPFDLLVDELKPARSLAHAPLFQVLLSMKNNEHVELVLPELTLSPLQDGRELAKFDLQLTVEETAEGLQLSWLYAQDLFEPATIARMGEAFVALLAAIVAAPQQRVAALPVMDAAATEAVLALSNGPQSARYRDAALPRQFAQQAAMTPDAVAVRSRDMSLRYAELDRLSDRVARRLRAAGQGRGTRVGVHLDRSVELIVSLLGVMKSGAAYVMLDTRQSAERLKA
ncbi:MAG TPA: amino acid adenylation domain-containing protein, partial [Tahibacter sp.]|uniref:non-ribosomal peptide synthetase n=1 Tax=Tahibacter sp. TaxID=2056211 RepID=UPI002B948BC0